MNLEDYCCWCNEPTYFKEGYQIWESFDGKFGHRLCVEKYDEKYKPSKMKIEEEILKLKNRIIFLDKEKENCEIEIIKLENKLLNNNE